MKLRDVIRVLRRSEVDRIEVGRDHIEATREGEAERAANAKAIRAEIGARPEGLSVAMKRRAKHLH